MTVSDVSVDWMAVSALRVDLAAFRTWAMGAVVGVVYGPRSVEDQLYVKSAPVESISLYAVMDSLVRQGFRPKHLDLTSPTFIDELRMVDLVFVNAHGEFGEDGRLQGLLEYLDKPYTGSGVLAGALGMNKVAFKQVMSGCRVPVPRYAVPDQPGLPLSVNEYLIDDLPLPIIVKPVSGGSSIGMTLLRSLDEVRETTGGTGHGLFVEEFIVGRSITVAVVDGLDTPIASPPIEVRIDGEFYDAVMKLGGAGSAEVHLVPMDGDPSVVEAIRETAVRVHCLLGCRGFSRVDFIVTSHGDYYVLEVNTIPGMTRGGNFVACLSGLGLTYDETVMLMLRSASLTVQS